MTESILLDWDKIIERHARRVFRVALRILGSVQDAEDVSQDVFTEAFRLHAAGPVQSWTGLLVRLATLRSLDRLRRNRSSVELRETDGMSNNEPFEEVVASELAQWLRKAVARLPDQQAAVFAMFHYEQLSRDEIAAALDVPRIRLDSALQSASTLGYAIGYLQSRILKMNHEYDSPEFENGDSMLDDAVRAVLAEPVTEDAVERVKSRAQLLAKPAVVTLPSEPAARPRRWKASRALVGGLAMAATVLIMVAGVTLLLDRSGGRAFAQVIEKVKATRSAHCKTAMRIGRKPEINGQLYLEGDHVRFEQFDGMLIQIEDFDRKQALFLDMRHKVAQTAEIDAKLAGAFANPIDQLRRANKKDAEQMGEEILRGRRTQIYRLHKVDLLGMKGDGEMLVWVDVESGLPAKIIVRDPDPKAEMEMRFDEFVWNEPLDAGLFSLSIPDGFEKGTVFLKPTPPEAAAPGAGSAESPSAFAEGILSRDRVPARIVWDRPGTAITALMRDPESVPPQSRRPNELRQWDVTTGKLRWSETVAGAGSVAGTADGKFLATVIGYEVQLRDAASGKVTKKWVTDKRLSPLAFSPDGKTLAAGVTEWGPFGGSGGKPSGGVQFWNVETAGMMRFIADDKPTTFVTYSGNGKYLATSSNEGPVKMWDVATGELTRIFPGYALASFSPDGKTIACQVAASTADKTIGRVDLFGIGDGSLVKSFTSDKGASASCLLCVTFSPDGQLLAASDWNGTVTLWNVATGQRKQTAIAAKAGVHTVVFAPDGKTIATGSEDKTLRLWKLPAELIEQEKK